MNRTELKEKLLMLIKEMLISNENMDVPKTVEEYILENHGWTIDDPSPSCEGDLNNFIRFLQNWIKNANVSKNKTCIHDNLGYSFDDLFDKYLRAETEYIDVTCRLLETVEQLIKFKEMYSEEFKNNCKYQENSVEVLTKKLEFLKLQFFIKLYKESNALSGHLKLREKLLKEVELLKTCYNEAIACNDGFEELKNNRSFIELFKIYKELRAIEKRTKILKQL